MAAAKDNVHFRCEREDKEIIEQAASLMGMTVTAYSRATLLERSRQVIKEAHRTRLSNADMEMFAAIVNDVEPPSETLRAAAKKYQKEILKDADGN